MAKKFLFFIIAALCCFGNVYAQLSDEQILDLVQSQMAQGATQESVVQQLMKRGVSASQLRRLKTKYDQIQQNSMVGNSIDMISVSRSRMQATSPLNTSGIIGNSADEAYYNASSKKMLQQSGVSQLDMIPQVRGVDESGLDSKAKLDLYMNESQFLFQVDSLTLLRQMLLEKSQREKEIFGHSIFQSKELSFEPSVNIATPKDYLLGAGDEIIIDIWGESENLIRDEISPDGIVMIEGFGPLHLAGLTISQAQEYAEKQLSRIYKGFNSKNPTSYISVSLGQNRSIQVNVMGEVENPGTYTLSSFSTVFNALYMAGGINELGSLRSIHIYRNNEKVSELDVYDYLLHGKIDSDIRLEDNDVVVVNPYSVLVKANGSLRRPMFYEMTPQETASQLIQYAGGLAANAYKGDVRVIRYGDVQREIFTLNADEQKLFTMHDGDTLFVDSVQQTFANIVEVQGAVYRPGQFQVGGSIKTVRQLIAAAGGVREDAFLKRAILNRRNSDLTLVNKALDLESILSDTEQDVELCNYDVLFIPAIQDVQEMPVMSIYGDVRFPGVYRYADSTQVEDLILQAGGLKESASISNVEIVRYSRNKKAQTENEKISAVYRFQIEEDLSLRDTIFYLEPYDNVNVLRSPGYSEANNVYVSGEVLFPGTYTLLSRKDRISDILERVGNCTSFAYPEGIILERTMTDLEKKRLAQVSDNLFRNDTTIRNLLSKATTYNIGFDIHKALKNYDSEDNIVLRNGDKIIVPAFQNTIKINGRVMYPNTLSYVDGKSLRYYINHAGGFGEKARRNRIYVINANGSVNRVRLSNSKKLTPGCEIIVPQKGEHQRMSPAEILSLGSSTASLATVIISLLNLFK